MREPLAWLGERLLSGTRAPSSAVHQPIFTQVRSFEEYERYRSATSAALQARSALEKLLAEGEMPFSYPGFDRCVRRPTSFLVDLEYGASRDTDGRLVPNYRERVVSPLTGLNSRQRAVALAMEELPGGVALERAAVYATERVTPFFEFVRRLSPGAIGSEFVGAGVERGSCPNGVRHEDVTQLTFRDGSFDVVVSNDVLEHVPEYRAGLRELLRVLKPGGLLLFTVPFLTDRYENVVRARVGASGLEHLLPPEYHGDPMNPDGGILCFQTFGWQLLDEMRDLGYSDAGAAFAWSYLDGILGRDVAVLFGRRGPE